MAIPRPRDATEHPDQHPPLRLSGCKPIRVLTGGMSHVYLCETFDSPFPREVAVKRLLPRLNAIDGVARRFTRECYLWLQMGSHAHVAPVIAVFAVPLEPPLVMLK